MLLAAAANEKQETSCASFPLLTHLVTPFRPSLDVLGPPVNNNTTPMHLASCVHYVSRLRDSSHVTRFQNFFGLQAEKVSVSNEKVKNKVNEIVPQATKYKVNNYFYFYLFSFGSKLGYELFYTILFSYLYWNFDSFVCRRLMLVWAILMYIGQALKDIIRWPRPQGPNVVILEPEYSFEYGMPSTHAILALSVPVNLFYILWTRYEFAVVAFVLGSFCWCTLICCSRLYLGMHSVLDIIAGLALTAILLVPILPMVDTLDHFLMRHWCSPAIIASVVILLACIYPKSNRLSPSRGDTCVIISACAGVYVGSWLNYHLGVIREDVNSPIRFLQPLGWIPQEDVLRIVVRTLIGLVVMVVLRSASKQTVNIALKTILAIDPTEPTKKHLAIVEIPGKLFTYTMVGLALAYAAPAVFESLRIDRLSMHTEA